jgi:hypothetical protein
VSLCRHANEEITQTAGFRRGVNATATRNGKACSILNYRLKLTPKSWAMQRRKNKCQVPSQES